jgi:phosphomannomutase / phosphoglucomutase
MLGGVPTTPEQLAQIRALAIDGDFRSGFGTYEAVDPLGVYEQNTLERWRHLDPTCFSQIILDAGNGAWSEIAPRIFSQLGFAVECISCVADGSFPDRPSDCSRTANLTALRAAVARHPKSLGIAWDGDGDRVAFIDETGLHVSADEISLLLAYAVMKSHGAQAKIVVDIKLSAVVRREILAHGGVPLLERTGHAFVRGRMVADDALLGLDACGHYFYRELSGGDDGLFAALFVLDLLQQSGLSLSALRSALPAIFTTPELRIPTHLLTLQDAVQRLTSGLPVVETLCIDGVQLILNDGIVLIRQSGTEPVLSLRMEGFHRTAFNELVELCLRLLSAAEPHLRNQLASSAH